MDANDLSLLLGAVAVLPYMAEATVAWLRNQISP